MRRPEGEECRQALIQAAEDFLFCFPDALFQHHVSHQRAVFRFQPAYQGFFYGRVFPEAVGYIEQVDLFSSGCHSVIGHTAIHEEFSAAVQLSTVLPGVLSL